MAQRVYYTGQTPVPGDGTAVPVCYIGVARALVFAASDFYVGGPDVTPSNGYPVIGDVNTEIPGLLVEDPPPVVPAPPPDTPALLYACATGGKAVTVCWLSGQPPPG